MCKVDKLEQVGKFVQADILRQIAAKRKKKTEVTGKNLAAEIINKVKEDVSEILTEYDLPTAIFYIEKITESSLQALESDLSSAIQEVLDKIMSRSSI